MNRWLNENIQKKDVSKKQHYRAVASLRSLAELLVEFYERRLTEAEAQKGKCDDDN